MKTAEDLDDEIISLIEEGINAPKDNHVFNQLALDLFEYQFMHNIPYKQYCIDKGKTPDTIHSWKHIPAVPTSAFKECDLACFPIERAEKVFHSSGTTLHKPGKHYLDTCTLYNESIIPNIKAHLLPDLSLIPVFSLTPPPEESSHSSLVHMIDLVMKLFGTHKSRYFIRNGVLETKELVETLREYEDSVTPVFLMGPAFSFVHFFDYCKEHHLRFHLPKQSRVMETGGFKGKSREITKEKLYELFSSILNIPETYCINEYGMSELGTQYYDNKLCNYINNINSQKYKVIPPWSRVLVLNPETLEEVNTGEQGLLQHVDLTNRGSIISILTDDIGYKIAEGFEIVGRSNKVEPRGCSIAIDEILSS